MMLRGVLGDPTGIPGVYQGRTLGIHEFQMHSSGLYAVSGAFQGFSMCFRDVPGLF